ncbi:MAG: nucleoside kinase [Oscillospiraceae bacterium]|nr:nucleoside kinase [Oscillospiraceae bacterium]
MRIIPVKSINTRVKDPEPFIEFSEEEYLSGIIDCALSITSKPHKPIILVTGPSGSGKTGTSHRLKNELIQMGYITHIISMDNYFIPLGNDIDGVDLESPERVDAALFQKQTEKILRCEEITLPVFDFANQKRNTGMRFKRGENDLVIFEGIHALNPEVSGNLSDSANKVYVSVRTRLKGNSSGITLHPSKIRLMRRFVRDKLFRARSFSQTMKNFDSVERGEELYIMPYKEHAEFDIDTFIPYEPCVYKKYILPDLKAAGKLSGLLASELRMILEELEGFDDDFVPEWSLVREFIGGGSLME